MEKLISLQVPTPIGRLAIIIDQQTVVSAGWFSEVGQAVSRLPEAVQELGFVRAKSIPGISDAVTAYFDGEIAALRSVATRQPGGDFHQKVWRKMGQIKPGTTVSYTDLARRAGNERASRAAAAACARNLVAPFLPCHLVLRSDGSLGGYYYGLDRKKWLLQHEGVAGF